MSEPFTPDDVLYRFTPTEEERQRYYQLPAEYVLTERHLWLRWPAGWQDVELVTVHLLIARLLQDRTLLTNEREEMRQEIAALKTERERYLSHAK